jgi:hypothetical protein
MPRAIILHLKHDELSGPKGIHHLWPRSAAEEQTETETGVRTANTPVATNAQK